MAHIEFEDQYDVGTAYAVGLQNDKGQWHDDPAHTTIYVLSTIEAREAFLAANNWEDGYCVKSIGLKWAKVNITTLYPDKYRVERD